MQMDFKLDIVQKQKLILTQTMQQSINVLQMSAYELREYIDKQFEENPVLEDELDLVESRERFEYKDIIKKRVDYKIKLEDGTFDFENDLTDYLKVRYSDYIYNNVGSTNLIDRMGYYKKCLVEIINKGFVPENNINTFVESFGLNRDYIDMNGAFIARISKNYDVMKLAKIAEKLPPEMLNMLLFQAEAFYDKYTKG